MLRTAIVRDAPFDIWGGGGLEFLLLANFFYHREKTIFFLAINVRQFFFNVSLYAFPIMYVTIWCLFWWTYFSSISTTNFFFLPTFLTNFFFMTFVATNYLFQFFLAPPPPRYQMVHPLALIHITFMIPSGLWTYEQIKCKCNFSIKQPKNFILS